MVHMRSIATLLAAGLLTACTSGTEADRGLSEPVRVTFEKPLNLVVLEARIRDQGPFRFFLDSGATSTVVDTELANQIGLATERASTERGTAAGSQVTVAPVRGGVDFELAPEFTIHVDEVITAPFGPTAQSMMGERFDGILGSALFHQHVIEIDYGNRSLAFHDPASYRYEGEGAVLELDFPERMPALPFIQATLINGEHRLSDFPILVDSGGKTNGMASVPTRRDWDSLVTPANRIFDSMAATGLANDAEGTTHESFFTRMDRLILGPFEFDNPQVSYSAGGPGIAVMGASLLHRFTAIFDYSRKRLILEPNADFDNPPTVDRSGAFLMMSDAEDGALEVLFVADGTPAQAAGLTRGDLIQAVDGVPASEIRLNEVRVMFGQTRKFRLKVQRGDQSLETVLETRSLFDD